MRAAQRTALTATKRGGRVRDRTQSKDTTPRNDQGEPRGDDDDDDDAPGQLKANFDVQEIVDAQMRVTSVDVKIPCVLAGVERSS